MTIPSRRLFIALPVDDEITHRSLQKKILSLEKFSHILRIVSQDNFHITIKFFGSVETDIADNLIANFKLLPGLKKIPFSLEGIGAFPSADHPSVIWAGVKCDENPLNEIVQTVELFASSNGFPAESRKFSPHLTLARIKKEKKVPAELKKFIKEERGASSELSVFKELVLFESVLKKTGPEYKKISVIQLV